MEPPLEKFCTVLTAADLAGVASVEPSTVAPTPDAIPDAGDFNQIDPVCDVKEGLCYRENAALHALTDGNRFELTECRRADKEFFKISKDVDAINVAQFPVTTSTLFHLCFYIALFFDPRRLVESK